MVSLGKLGGFFQGLAGGIQQSRENAFQQQALQIRKEEAENRKRLLESDLAKTNQQIASSQLQNQLTLVGLAGEMYDQRLDSLGSQYTRIAEELQGISQMGSMGQEDRAQALQSQLQQITSQINEVTSAKSQHLDAMLKGLPSIGSGDSTSPDLSSFDPSFPSRPSGGKAPIKRDLPQPQMTQPADTVPQGAVPMGRRPTVDDVRQAVGGATGVQIHTDPNGMIMIGVPTPMVESKSTATGTRSVTGELLTGEEGGDASTRVSSAETVTKERSDQLLKQVHTQLRNAGFPIDPNTGEFEGVMIMPLDEMRGIKGVSVAETAQQIQPIVEEKASQNGVGTKKSPALRLDPESGMIIADREWMNDLPRSLQAGASLVDTIEELFDRGVYDDDARDALAVASSDILQSIKEQGTASKALRQEGDELVWDPFHPEAATAQQIAMALDINQSQASEDFRREQGVLIRRRSMGRESLGTGDPSPDEVTKYFLEHVKGENSRLGELFRLRRRGAAENIEASGVSDREASQPGFEKTDLGRYAKEVEKQILFYVSTLDAAMGEDWSFVSEDRKKAVRETLEALPKKLPKPMRAPLESRIESIMRKIREPSMTAPGPVNR